MRGRYGSVGALFCALLFFGSTLAVSQEAPRGRLIHAEMETELVPSPAKFDVLLPPDYEAILEPLPLVIWLHGGSSGVGHLERRIREHVESAWALGVLSPAVIVTPVTGNSYYIDWNDGSQKWESFIVDELLKHMREQYNVRRDREGTVLAGASAGGQGTLRIALRNPEVFVAAAAMEPGFPPVLSFDEFDTGRFRPGAAARFLTPRFGNPVDKNYWAERHPPTIVLRHADRIRESGLQLRVEAGDADANLTWLSAELLHRLLFDAAIPHEYYVERGAAHVGRSMPRRLHLSFAFLDRALNPQGPDLEAERHLKGAVRNGRFSPRVPNQLPYVAPDFRSP